MSGTGSTEEGTGDWERFQSLSSPLRTVSAFRNEDLVSIVDKTNRPPTYEDQDLKKLIVGLFLDHFTVKSCNQLLVLGFRSPVTVVSFVYFPWGVEGRTLVHPKPRGTKKFLSKSQLALRQIGRSKEGRR